MRIDLIGLLSVCLVLCAECHVLGVAANVDGSLGPKHEMETASTAVADARRWTEERASSLQTLADDVKLVASPSTVGCGQSSRLSWSSPQGSDTEISAIGKVSNQGEQAISPQQTTSYAITVKNPSGVFNKTVTVTVDTEVRAVLTVASSELRYRKLGDKILTQDVTTLQWTTSNADSVSIDPYGKVDLSGGMTIKAEAANNIGPVDESRVYTLHASNMCGGSASQSATVHIVGSVEPVPTEIPEFPKWPKWTERYLLPEGLVVDGRTAELGTAFDRIRGALNSAKIPEWSIYSLGKDGFAVVTRMETINENGVAKAEPERWSIASPPSVEPFSLVNYLKVLFVASPGYYRVIVLAVTPHQILAGDSQQVADTETMDSLLRQGASDLPPSYRKTPVSPGTRCDAFIYEFYRATVGDPVTMLESSGVTAPQHLIGAGLWKSSLPNH